MYTYIYTYISTVYMYPYLNLQLYAFLCSCLYYENKVEILTYILSSTLFSTFDTCFVHLYNIQSYEKFIFQVLHYLTDFC